MPSYKVQWQQQATITATVSVDLDELAQWAVEVVGMRTLHENHPEAADIVGVRRMLENNRHLRDELLRRWASSHLPRT